MRSAGGGEFVQQRPDKASRVPSIAGQPPFRRLPDWICWARDTRRVPMPLRWSGARAPPTACPALHDAPSKLLGRLRPLVGWKNLDRRATSAVPLSASSRLAQMALRRMACRGRGMGARGNRCAQSPRFGFAGRRVFGCIRGFGRGWHVAVRRVPRAPTRVGLSGMVFLGGARSHRSLHILLVRQHGASQCTGRPRARPRCDACDSHGGSGARSISMAGRGQRLHRTEVRDSESLVKTGVTGSAACSRPVQGPG